MTASKSSALRPLADLLRPRALHEFVGQRHLLASGKPLGNAIRSGRLHSMLLWGPPGTGKTTLARLVAGASGAEFSSVSAVLSGVKEIRAAVAAAERTLSEAGRATVLFVDEVHRFNKSQQDAFLPHVESGLVTFIGATTENPAFEVNAALLSRAKVYVLKRLELDDIATVVERARPEIERRFQRPFSVAPDAVSMLCDAADGDARRALNALEIAAARLDAGGKEDIEVESQAGGHEVVLDVETVAEALSGGSVRRFDKGGDDFYDQISALHKSIRGSDPDASLYWLCRMLDGGCDPLYLTRRLARIASEDVGNADPRALRLALDAWEVQERLGSPEGELALAQCAVYLAVAPKSNAVYKAFGAAMDDVRRSGSREVPVHLRNAPTRLARELGHGRAYRYPHDEPDAYVAGECYFPDDLRPRRYYTPSPRGLEIRIAEKLERLAKLDRRQGPGRRGRGPTEDASAREPEDTAASAESTEKGRSDHA